MKTPTLGIVSAALRACDHCKRFVKMMVQVCPFCVATLGCHAPRTAPGTEIHADSHEQADAAPTVAETARYTGVDEPRGHVAGYGCPAPCPKPPRLNEFNVTPRGVYEVKDLRRVLRPAIGVVRASFNDWPQETTLHVELTIDAQGNVTQAKTTLTFSSDAGPRPWIDGLSAKLKAVKLEAPGRSVKAVLTFRD